MFFAETKALKTKAKKVRAFFLLIPEALVCWKIKIQSNSSMVLSKKDVF